MNIIENTTIYHCSYCPKYYARKHHCVSHEKWCKHKPENKHKCFELCKHLIMTNYETGKDFTCSAQCNKRLYSYKAEKHNSRFSSAAEKGEIIDISESERMPLECPLYAPIDYSVPDDSNNFPF